jgi:hypothetical protein
MGRGSGRTGRGAAATSEGRRVLVQGRTQEVAEVLGASAMRPAAGSDGDDCRGCGPARIEEGQQGSLPRRGARRAWVAKPAGARRRRGRPPVAGGAAAGGAVASCRRFAASSKEVKQIGGHMRGRRSRRVATEVELWPLSQQL